jgi:hypothetical protein
MMLNQIVASGLFIFASLEIQMERVMTITRKIVLLFVTVTLSVAASSQDESDKAQAISERVAIDVTNEQSGISIGSIYQSRYYWRGQWFYGQSAGVFFPYLSYNKKNLYLYAGGEYGENIVFDSASSNESGFGKVEKDWTGVDLGAVYSWSLDQDKIGISFGAWYFWYLRSKYIGNDGINNSFADLRIAASLKKVFLTPTLSYSHYFRVDESYAERTKEDAYISFALQHDLPFNEGATINLLGTVNYWHYASQEQSPLYGKVGEIPSGLSDATLKFGLTLVKKRITLKSSFNYAYVFNDKFDYNSGSRFDQNKFWTSFAVEYAY